MKKAQNTLKKQKPQQRGSHRRSELEAGLEKAVQQSIRTVRSKIDSLLKNKSNNHTDKNA